MEKTPIKAISISQTKRLYVYADGTAELHTGGTAAWRNNNPGNVKFGTYTKDSNFIGQDNYDHLVFPTIQDGLKAQANLLQRMPLYKDYSIAHAIPIYAPVDDPQAKNNPTEYIAFLAKNSGLDVYNKKIKDMSAEEMQTLVTWMNKFEKSAKGNDTHIDNAPSQYEGLKNKLDATTPTDPATLNLSPTTFTNKFNNETLRDFLNKKQAETADNKNTTNHTDNTAKDTTSTNNTSSDKSQVCTETLPKSDLDLKGEASITTEKLGSNGSIIAQTYDSEGNLTNAVVLSSNSKSELSFSNGEIVSSKTTQTDGIVSTKEYSNDIVSKELIQNGDSTTNVAYSNGIPFIATTTNQTDSTLTNTIYSNDGKSISAKTLEQSDGTVMSQSSCKTKMVA